MYDAGQHTVQEIADTVGVSRPTTYRHLAGAGGPPAPTTLAGGHRTVATTLSAQADQRFLDRACRVPRQARYCLADVGESA